MVPSTGYLATFDMRPYDIGFLIQYPRAEVDGEIPEFKNAPPKSKATIKEISLSPFF